MKKTATPKKGVVGWRGKAKPPAAPEPSSPAHASYTKYCVWCQQRRFFGGSSCLVCGKET